MFQYSVYKINMNTLDEFHCLVGETIMYCQCIEHDIKLIYAGMLQGNFDVNLQEIEDSPLGPVLKKLENLDNSDGNPHLSTGDYDLLDQIRDIRNHWAHKAYTKFVYSKNSLYNKNFLQQYRRIENDHNRLAKLSDSIEKVRLDVLKKYNRI